MFHCFGEMQHDVKVQKEAYRNICTYVYCLYRSKHPGNLRWRTQMNDGLEWFGHVFPVKYGKCVFQAVVFGM